MTEAIARRSVPSPTAAPRAPLTPSRLLWLALVAGLSLGLVACGGDDLPEVDCDAVQVQGFSELEIMATCTACHSSQLSGAQRFGAPSDVNYDTFAAAMAEAEDGVQEVFEDNMPPGGGVPQAQKDAFAAWALCGTPQ